MKAQQLQLEDMADNAQAASDLLRALSHEARLMILCMLVEGEKTVSELEDLLNLRQSSVSQQLARLRGDRLVNKRREGKAIYYSLASSEAKAVIETIYELYCGKKTRTAGTA